MVNIYYIIVVVMMSTGMRFLLSFVGMCYHRECIFEFVRFWIWEKSDGFGCGFASSLTWCMRVLQASGGADRLPSAEQLTRVLVYG